MADKDVSPITMVMTMTVLPDDLDILHTRTEIALFLFTFTNEPSSQTLLSFD